MPITVCPVWKRSNEVYETIHTTRTSTQPLTLCRKKLSRPAEAGLLFLAMTQGWENVSSEWMQSPALLILKQMDEFLFSALGKMERLATAYKSFKLLKVREPSRRIPKPHH